MTTKNVHLYVALVALLLFIVTMTGGSSVWADEPQLAEVESRGLAPMPQRSQSNAGQALQEPSWPQQFDVRGPETDGFGFAVTQPGPINVEVQSQGSPITVTLRGPGLPPHAETGTGRVRLAHQVTSQDVARGLFWRVQIRSWCEEDCLVASNVQTPIGRQPLNRKAAGTIVVQHPPVDHAQVRAATAVHQQAVQRQVGQRQAEMQQVGTQAAAQMEASFQQRKAQFDQQRHQRHAALMAKAQPLIDQLRLRGPGQVRTRGIEESEAAPAEATPEEPDEIETRGFSRTRPSGGFTAAPSSPPVMTKIPEAQTNAPSQQIQSTSSALTYMPDPIIASLSVSQGQPGDPVMINGNGFGDTGGEVHFVIGPGKDLIAPAGVVWRNDQIFATVPEAVGIVAFSGITYVVRGSDKRKSNVTQFQFRPELELRILTPIRSDVTLQPFEGIDLALACRNFVTGDGDNCWTARVNPYIFWGPKGNDQFFVNTRLKNGWLVFQEPALYFPSPNYTDGGAYTVESRVATDSPYVNVRWWVPGGLTIQNLAYGYSMLIQGPKGVPDGIVCKQSLC